MRTVVESDIDNDAGAKVYFFFLLIVISFILDNIICVVGIIFLFSFFFIGFLS